MGQRYLLVAFDKRAAGEKKSKEDEALSRVFAQVVEDVRAGSPSKSDEQWVSLKPGQIQHRLQARDYEVSRHVVNELLANAGLRRRSYHKSIRGGEFEHRDQQFE